MNLNSLFLGLVVGSMLTVRGGAENLWPDDGSFETGHKLFIQKAQRGDAVDGEYALFVPPGEDLLGGYAAAVLQSGKTYVFSAWLKSPVATTVQPQLWTERYTPVARAKVKLEPGVWKQLILPLDASKGVSIRFLLKKDSDVPLLIDGIKLALRDDGAEAVTYSPTAPISAGVLRNDGVGEVIYRDAKPLSRLFRIRNNSEETRRIQGRVTLEAPEFPERELWKGEVLLPPGKTFEKELELLPETVAGYYLVRSRVSDDRGCEQESAMPFLVTAPPRKSDDLFMGLHAWRGPTERYQRIGCKVTRTFIRWASVTDGRYNPATENGFIQQHCIEVLPPPGHIRKNPDGTPTADELEKFFTDYYRNHPESIHWIEFQNEPDLGWRFGKNSKAENAVHYAEYYRDFARIARKVMPQAKLCAAGVAGDDFGEFPFMREAMKLIGSEADCVPIHPYAHARYIDNSASDIGPELNGTWEKTINARNVIAPETELTYGEIGWALDVRCDWLSAPVIRHSQYLARLFLMARALNIGTVQWIPGDDHLERTSYHYGLWRNSLPLPAAAAYAMTAQRLDGAKPVSILENDGVYLYVFRDADGRLFAAGWTIDKLPVKITLPFAPGSVELCDWLGREYPVDGTQFELTRGPRYWIAGPGTADEDFLKALENRFIDRMSLTIRRRPVSRNKVAFDFENRGMKAFAGNIDFNGEHRTLKLDAPKATGWQIQPVCTTMEFTVPDAGAAMSLGVTEGKGKKHTIPFREDPLLPLRGALPRLDSRDWLLPNDPTIGYDGANDLSVDSRFDWNSETLIFDLKVTDDVHETCPRNVWQGDSVQLAIDPEINGEIGFDADDFEFAFAVDGDRVVTECCFAPPDVVPESTVKTIRATGSRKGKTTLYHIEIPWKTLRITPVSGKVIALNFIVNDADADGRGRACWMGLTPGIGEGKTPGVYRKFILE